MRVSPRARPGSAQSSMPINLLLTHFAEDVNFEYLGSVAVTRHASPGFLPSGLSLDSRFRVSSNYSYDERHDMSNSRRL